MGILNILAWALGAMTLVLCGALFMWRAVIPKLCTRLYLPSSLKEEVRSAGLRAFGKGIWWKLIGIAACFLTVFFPDIDFVSIFVRIVALVMIAVMLFVLSFDLYDMFVTSMGKLEWAQRMGRYPTVIGKLVNIECTGNEIGYIKLLDSEGKEHQFFCSDLSVLEAVEHPSFFATLIVFYDPEHETTPLTLFIAPA